MLVSIFSRAFWKCVSVVHFRVSFKCSSSPKNSSVRPSPARSHLSAVSGVSIRHAALILGPIWNPMMSAFHSIESFPSRKFLSPIDSDCCICLSPRVVIIRFSPKIGIQSATVPSDAKSIYRVRILCIAFSEFLLSNRRLFFSSFKAISIPCNNLNATPAPARSRKG